MNQNIIPDLFIKPDFDSSAVSILFTAPAETTNCQWKIISNKNPVAKGESIVKPEKKVLIKEFLENFTPWTTSEPHLYKLQLTLTIGKRQFEIFENFGMQKIETRGKWIYVNNEKFYARGHIRGREAHDHPNFENLPLDQFYIKNIKAAKQYGFNLIRFHSRIPCEECLKVADKLGIFIHVELRKYFGKYQKERSMMNDEGDFLDKQQWIETILKLRNHPCIMAYCMGNEIRKPGHNPFVREIAKLTKELDPTRLFIDTCAHGEFDRDYVDFDVQHMSYYYPFGENYDMFEHTYNWHIYGSCQNLNLIKEENGCKINRTLEANRPILAHEICHYAGLHDIAKLDSKFKKLDIKKPWWIDELKNLLKIKNLEEDYPQMYKASKEFQKLSWKLGIEAVRRSSLLSGFHFLQLSDTELYENSNGILDCFDDKRDIDPNFFLKFNNESVVLADLPKRTFFENDILKVPVLVSHFSEKLKDYADLVFSLNTNTGTILKSCSLEKVDLTELGLKEICNIQVTLPEIEQPQALTLKIKLTFKETGESISNDWPLWLYPDKPQKLSVTDCKINLDSINLTTRYPQFKSNNSNLSKLLITNKFTDEVFTHLQNGNDVLMLYRVAQTHDILKNADKEKYYFPTTLDRCKGVIWDRGTNCGGFIRETQLSNLFPNNGFIDLQFYDLINDCDKMILDDFPCKLAPIIQGVDKAVRDRFDVYTYKLSELQPEWTMRKFGYLIELKVGAGRLLMSGFNFTGINENNPATCAMFEALIKYIQSENFKPQDDIPVKQLQEYLVKKAGEPKIKERKMTQFWQLNNLPLESDIYWKEAEEYLAQ